MKRLKLLMLVFCLAISLPLAYVVRQSFLGLSEEERTQLRFFSQTLFDEMENKLASLVQQEENRAVDEYRHTLADGRSPSLSPLAEAPRDKFIIGYLQNNPDGSFQTPLVDNLQQVPETKRELIAQLKAANSIFNQRKLTLAETTPPVPAPPAEAPKREAEKKEQNGFVDRYLARPSEKVAKSYLGQKSQRTEEITAGQALNFSMDDQSAVTGNVSKTKGAAPGLAMLRDEKSTASTRQMKIAEESLSPSLQSATGEVPAVPVTAAAGLSPNHNRFEVEVAPLQSVAIGDGQFFIFRRVAINNQIFRQGFILKVQPFLDALAAEHFTNQPMSRFSSLSLKVADKGQKTEMVRTGIQVSTAGFITQRTFPAPFDFLSAAVRAETPPASPARRTLTIALTILGIVILLGLFAIYKSAVAVLDLSERRSQFVSSVTHELKTPLTNIRMYIEMLEEGIAATPEREAEYFHILGSESARLSRLINNVLELAKLEKNQRRFDPKPGNLQEVISEVQTVMAHKLSQEGFTLKTRIPDHLWFDYDREVMIQVFINLVENSIKFGRTAPERIITIAAASRNSFIDITVSDTGPGIPKKALKKIFGDFYRVDNELTRATGGTGIGLALVKKFITAMGGKVRADNNPETGCTITLSLPTAERENTTAGTANL